jgi:hypothetical protein
MTTKEQLQKTCKNIADDISNGIILTNDNIDEYYNEDLVYTIGDTVTAYEYFKDCLDISFTISQTFDYQHGSIVMALGGPNIYVDTEDNYVKGYWGRDVVNEPFVDSIGVDDYLEDMFLNSRNYHVN